jgi:molybdate transport system regulatory protein
VLWRHWQAGSGYRSQRFSGKKLKFIMVANLVAGIFGSAGDLKQDDHLAAKAKKQKRSSAPAAKKGSRATPRLRIVMGKGVMLGPGKIDLLEGIARKGSISAAAREMDMSYRRAWLLVEAMNQMFARPLVIAAPGGARGGGAQVTEFGLEVAAAYRRIVERTHDAILEEMARFEAS